MKILITAPNLDEQQNVSGISTVVRQIIESSNLEFSHFVAGRKDGVNIRLGWMLDQMFLLPRFFLKIRQEKPDILHLNTSLTPLAIGRDVILAKVAKSLKIPILLHLHGGKFLTQGFKGGFFKRLTAKMLNLSEVVVVLSKIEKKFIEDNWQDLNIHVLENAVLPVEVKRVKDQKAEKTIIFLGRLHESKGLHEIIETCRALKSERFSFDFKCFGTGPLKDFFNDEMQKILGKRFYYGGVVAGAEKWKALAEADIFLLPSRYGEGLPMALLEAMAAGCVAVVSDNGSSSRVVKDGENGFLVKSRDASQIVEKLKILLSDEVDWENLRKNAENTIEEKFNLKDYIEKLENIYREIRR